MARNLKSESSLLDSQMEQLLKEMSTIINDHWKSLNNKGYVCIKTIFDNYSDVLNELKELDDEDENENENEPKQNLKYAHLVLLDECNVQYDKLNEIV